MTQTYPRFDIVAQRAKVCWRPRVYDIIDPDNHKKGEIVWFPLGHEYELKTGSSSSLENWSVSDLNCVGNFLGRLNRRRLELERLREQPKAPILTIPEANAMLDALLIFQEQKEAGYYAGASVQEWVPDRAQGAYTAENQWIAPGVHKRPLWYLHWSIDTMCSAPDNFLQPKTRKQWAAHLARIFAGWSHCKRRDQHGWPSTLKAWGKCGDCSFDCENKGVTP